MGAGSGGPRSSRTRASRQPILEPEPLADERQEPRPTLVRRWDDREAQLRDLRLYAATDPFSHAGPEIRRHRDAGPAVAHRPGDGALATGVGHPVHGERDLAAPGEL